MAIGIGVFGRMIGAILKALDRGLGFVVTALRTLAGKLFLIMVAIPTFWLSLRRLVASRLIGFVENTIDGAIGGVSGSEGTFLSPIVSAWLNVKGEIEVNGLLSWICYSANIESFVVMVTSVLSLMSVVVTVVCTVGLFKFVVNIVRG